MAANYRMRAFDTNLGRLVFWTATIIDTTGAQYSGPGPLTGIVIQSEIDGAGGGGVTVEEGGSPVVTGAANLNFVNASVVDNAGTADITTSGGGGGVTIEQAGSTVVSAATHVNFVSGATVANNAGVADVTIPAGGVTVEQAGSTIVSGATHVNFISGATVVDNAGVADVTVAGGVNVKHAGTTVVSGAANVNFVSGATVTNNAGTADIAVSGGVDIENTRALDVPVGRHSVTPDSAFVYVANTGSTETIAVVDTSTNKVIATIAVGNTPYYTVITPDGAHVYVANVLDKTVSVIQTSDNTVIATVPVPAFGLGPTDLAITPDGTHVYCLNYGDGTTGTTSCSVIRVSDNTVVATVACGDNPQFVSVAPNSAHVYINNNSDRITVIETTGFTHTEITAGLSGGAPGAIAVTADNAHIYVPATATGVKVYRTSDNTVTATVTVGNSPFWAVASPDGLHIYVYNFTDLTISVIQTSNNAVVATVPTGSGPGGPGGIVVSPDSAHVYVANSQDSTITMIETTGFTVVSTIALTGTFPSFISVAPNNAHAYVGSNPNILSVIKASDQSVAIVTSVADLGFVSALRLSGAIVTDVGGGVLQIETGHPPNPYAQNGTDGVLIFDGVNDVLGITPVSNVYTLAADIFPFSMTVNAGITVRTNGKRIFNANTINLVSTTSVISAGGLPVTGRLGSASGCPSGAFFSGGGTSGGNGANGPAVGSNGTASSQAIPSWPSNSATPANTDSFIQGGGGGGGNAGANAGGTGGAIVASGLNAGGLSQIQRMTGTTDNRALSYIYTYGSTGGGGAVTGGGGSTGTGGGGGGSGGWLYIATRFFAGAGRVDCNGADGGNAVAGTSTGCGGGGGGGGGICCVDYVSNLGTVTFVANGGAGGTKTGTGNPGGHGWSGTVSIVNLSQDGT